MIQKAVVPLCAALLAAGCCGGGAREALRLTPAPVEVEYRGSGTFDPAATPVKSGIADLGLPPEGYILELSPDGITVTGQDDAGLFRGETSLENLRELYSVPGGSELPDAKIIDYPAYGYRGVMVDVARHFRPVDDLKRFIDVMARYKLNRLHLHLTDDQGWRFPVPGYPELTTVGATRGKSEIWPSDGEQYGPFFYTRDELLDIVAYAKAHHIEIMPEVDMPGHSLAALASYPKLGCTGGPYAPMTTWGQSQDILCGGNAETWKFVGAVISELAGIFPYEYIHIGGDECPLWRWHECPRCQAAIKAAGVSGELEFEHRFVRRVADIAAAHGKKVMGWDELLDCGVPDDAVVMAWRGDFGSRSAAKRGHKVVVSSYSHLYFDYAPGTGADEWSSGACRVNLRRVYGFDPLFGRDDAKLRGQILGAQSEHWSEGIFTMADLEYKAWPRAIAEAETLWSPESRRDYRDFSNRVSRELAILWKSGHSPRCAPPELADVIYFSDEFVYDIGELPPEMDIIYTLDGSVPSENTAAAQRYSKVRPRVTDNAKLTMQYDFAARKPERRFPVTVATLRKSVPAAAAELSVPVESGLVFAMQSADGVNFRYAASDFDFTPAENRRAGKLTGTASGFFYAPETANYEFTVGVGGRLDIAVDGIADKFSYTGPGVFDNLPHSFFLEKGFHPIEFTFELGDPIGHGGRIQIYVESGTGEPLPLDGASLFHHDADFWAK
ncbi:MAG: beta-N-acetylhexosaminidase [Victivallaceae bacterium]|nr:beta-N-acetylhexosaminidase [Victivallaceae bacterium]